jgi:hypothetical protein
MKLCVCYVIKCRISEGREWITVCVVSRRNRVWKKRKERKERRKRLSVFVFPFWRPVIKFPRPITRRNKFPGHSTQNRVIWRRGQYECSAECDRQTAWPWTSVPSQQDRQTDRHMDSGQPVARPHWGHEQFWRKRHTGTHNAQRGSSRKSWPSIKLYNSSTHFRVYNITLTFFLTAAQQNLGFPQLTKSVVGPVAQSV